MEDNSFLGLSLKVNNHSSMKFYVGNNRVTTILVLASSPGKFLTLVFYDTTIPMVVAKGNQNKCGTSKQRGLTRTRRWDEI